MNYNMKRVAGISFLLGLKTGFNIQIDALIKEMALEHDKKSKKKEKSLLTKTKMFRR